MPYVSDSNLDENQQTEQTEDPSKQPGQVSGQPATVSGATGTQSAIQNQNSATDMPEAPTLATDAGTPSSDAGGKAPSSQSTYNANAPTSSGQWVNLQNYLNANNGGQFGEQFAGKVGKDVNEAQGAVSKASQGFGEAVDQNTIQNNEKVLGEVGTSPQTMSPDDQEAFKKQYTGTYQGPQSTADDPNFQRASAQAHSAFSESQQAGTPGGQTALLKRFYGNPNYTPGSQALDSAILSADPNAQAALSSLSKNASGLPVSYEAAERSANAKASGGQATSAAAHESAVKALYGEGGSSTDIKGGAYGNIQNDVTQRVTGANTKSDTDWAKLQAHLSGGNLTQEDLALLGTEAPKLTDRNYGVSISPYLTQGAQATTNTAISKDQAAALAALDSLSGNPETFITDPTQAGSYKPGVTFDNGATGYGAQVANAQKSYETQLQALNANIAQAQARLDGQRFNVGPHPQDGPTLSLTENAQLHDQIARDTAAINKLKYQYGGIVSGAHPYAAPIDISHARTVK